MFGKRRKLIDTNTDTIIDNDQSEEKKSASYDARDNSKKDEEDSVPNIRIVHEDGSKSIYAIIRDGLNSDTSINEYILPRELFPELKGREDGEKDGIKHSQGTSNQLDEWAMETPVFFIKRYIKGVFEKEVFDDLLNQYFKKRDCYDCYIYATSYIFENRDEFPADKLYEIAIYETVGSTHIECVKFGLALLSLFNMDNREDLKSYVRTLAKCNEFTKYALLSIAKWDYVAAELLTVAKNVSGWGRYFALQYISIENDDAQEEAQDDEELNEEEPEEEFFGDYDEFDDVEVDKASDFLIGFFQEKIDPDQPNWPVIEGWIKHLDEYINMLGFGDDEETLLSALIYQNGHNGKKILELVRLFLKNGYDVSANDGKNGAYCLHRLCHGRYDQYLPRIAELFLDEGADISLPFTEDYGPDDVEDTIWSFISHGDGDDYDYEYSNLYNTFLTQVMAYSNKQPYTKIRSFNECIGMPVRRVEKLALDKESINDDLDAKDSFSGAMAIWVDNKPLIVTEDFDFMVNPHIPKEAVTKIDITKSLGSTIVGYIVKELKFYSWDYARITLENPKTGSEKYFEFYSGRYSGVNQKIRYLLTSESAENVDLKVGMTVQRVYLRNGRSWVAGRVKYHEFVFFMQMQDKVIEFTSVLMNKNKTGFYDSTDDMIYSLIPKSIPLSWFPKRSRHIVGGPYYIGGIMRGDDNSIKSIHLVDYEDNNLVFVVNHSSEIWFGKFSIDEQGEEKDYELYFEE